MQVCHPYEMEFRSHNQLGQLDLQICCNSQLIYEVFYGKHTRSGKILGLIVAKIYLGIRFIFFHQL